MLGVPFSAHEAGLSDTVLSGSAKVDLKQSCMKSFEEPTLSVNIIIPYSQFYSAPISMYKKIEQYKTDSVWQEEVGLSLSGVVFVASRGNLGEYPGG